MVIGLVVNVAKRALRHAPKVVSVVGAVASLTNPGVQDASNATAEAATIILQRGEAAVKALDQLDPQVAAPPMEIPEPQIDVRYKDEIYYSTVKNRQAFPELNNKNIHIFLIVAKCTKTGILSVKAGKGLFLVMVYVGAKLIFLIVSAVITSIVAKAVVTKTISLAILAFNIVKTKELSDKDEKPKSESSPTY